MSWNQSVVTNAGVGLLNESLAGHTLTIESAVGGAGTMTEEELAAATDVVDQKQTFSLLGIEDIEGVKRVGIQITNKGVQGSYILHQIGVKARLEYEEAPLTLLCILQDEHGVEIPTEAENPDWLFEIYAIISISNKANITINVSTSAIASVSYVNDGMDKKANVDLSNLNTPQAALANLGAGVRPNELDNPGLDINQSGQDAYDTSSASSYTVDRWWSLFGQYTVSTKTLAQNGTSEYSGVFRQPVSNPARFAGKTVTFTVWVESGSGTVGLTKASGVNSNMVPISVISVSAPGVYSKTVELDTDVGGETYPYLLFAVSTNSSIQFASPVPFKLEFGAGQTLAYQDTDGTWQLLPQPDMDYTTQLTRCQRYQVPIASGISVRASLVATNYIVFLVPVPCTLRATPSLSGTGLTVRSIEGSIESGFTFSVDYSGPGWVRIRGTKTSHGLSDAELTTTAQVMLVSNL